MNVNDTPARAVEQSLLCLALTSWASPDVQSAMTRLEPGMWASPKCRAVYEAVMAIVTAGGVPDMVLVASHLDPVHLDELVACMGRTPTEQAGVYAREIRARAVTSATVRALRATVDDLEACPHDVTPALRIEHLLPRITRAAVSEQTIEAQYEESIAEARRLRAEARDGRPAGIRTGFAGLDGIIGGWQPGLHVVAGRRSAGKSAFLVSAIIAAAESQKRIRFVSLDMPRLIYHYRVASHLHQVPLSMYIHRKDAAWAGDRLAETQQFLLGAGCYFAEQERDAREIVRAARATSQDWDILFLDYLQATRGRGSLYERMTELAYGLKTLALEHSKPIVALCQVPNPTDAQKKGGGPPKAPNLNQLKGSGDIADAALTVIFPYRTGVDGYGGGQDEPAELIVGKSQNTCTGVVSVQWEGECLRYRETGQQDRLF